MFIRRKKKKEGERRKFQPSYMHTPVGLQYYFLFSSSLLPSFFLSLSPFMSLSLSLSLSLPFSFSNVSFLFDDTNIDSIGDNKSYHFLMNACIRSIKVPFFKYQKSFFTYKNIRSRISVDLIVNVTSNN